MHKMDSERKGCNHRDVAWGPLSQQAGVGQSCICRDCGFETTYLTVQLMAMDYDKQVQKKQEGGFDGPK
jgi:hypothetical protein